MVNDDQTLLSVPLKARLEPGRIDRNQYAVSLLAEAIRAGLVGAEQVASFEVSLLPLVHRLVERKTRGESTSLPAHEAQGLLHAILCSIDCALLAIGDDGRALGALCSQDPKTLWEQGQKQLTGAVEKAKKLYDAVLQTRTDVGLIAYDDTVTKGIPPFFSEYDPVFASHICPADIDYPLAVDDWSATGIRYLTNYLQNLLCENRFCGAFPQKSLAALLKSHMAQYGANAREQLVNLFSLALCNALLCVSLGRSVKLLVLTSDDIALLQRKLGSLSGEALGCWYDGASAAVLAELALADDSVAAYLQKAKPGFLRELAAALGRGTLDRLALAKTAPPPSPSFAEGRRLDDRSLRALIAMLGRTQTAQRRVALIRRHVRARADLLDLLRADVLDRADQSALYHSFGDLELALLASALLPEASRAAGEGGGPAAALIAQSSAGDEPGATFASFLLGLPDDRLRAVLSQAAALVRRGEGAAAPN